MTQDEATRWCPHCRQATVNAPVPQLGSSLERLSTPHAPGNPQGFRRKLYCTECRAIWESLELPQPFVEELIATQQALEDARRQISMLRFLSASERVKEQATSMTIPLRKAG